MDDTSSAFSDDSIFAPVNAPDKQPTVEPFKNLFEDIRSDEFTKTAAAARWAKQYDPDAYARAKSLAPGVDPETAVRQLSLLETTNNLEQYRSVFEKAPMLRGYFAERPKELPLAKPDELDNIGGLSWLVQAPAQSLAQGFTQYQAAMASNRVAAARAAGTEPSIADRSLIANFEGDRTFGADGFWQEALVLTAGQAAQIGLTGVHALRGALVGSVGGGAVGAGIGSVVPGPGTVAGGAAGMVAGAQAGGALGAYTFQQALQTGLSRMEFERFRDEEGKPLEPELVELAAQVTGAGGALLESLSLGTFMKTLPGGDQIKALLTKSGLKAALKNKPVREALLSFAKNTAKVTGTEIGTEVLQQALQITAGELAKANSEGEFATKTAEEITQELGQTAYQTFQLMAIMGPLAAGTRLGADLHGIRQSRQLNENLTRVMTEVQDNELITRSPELGAALIDKQTNGQKLYIPAQDFVELYQSQGLDIYGPAIPNWRSKLDEALRTSGDVETTVGEFIAYIGKDPKENPLLALVRAQPDGYSTSEIQPIMEAMDELILTEAQKAAKAATLPASATPQASQIELFPEIEELRQQIKAIGFAPQAVESYTTLLASYFNTMAERTGVTPSEFYNEFKLSIVADAMNNEQDISNELNPTIRGSFTRNNGQALIKLFDGHDMSTLLHESGHFFLESFSSVANKTPELSADFDLIRKKLKMKKDEKFSRDHHEQFAKMVEAYLMQGKAPSPELKATFANFKRWLVTLYRNMRGLGGKVSPEMAKVFDRMLVTERRFEELAADRAYAPIFQTAEDMGMTPEEYLQFQQVVEETKAASNQKSLERIAGQHARFSKGWRREIQKQLESEAEAKLLKQAPYIHIQAFKDNKIAMNPELYAAQYSKTSSKAFPAKAFKANGMDPNVVAELLGYPTADEMVHDFVNAPPIKQAAREIAEKEMATRYEADFDQSEVMDLAIRQTFAEEGRMTILGAEYKALAKKKGTEVSAVGPKQLIKQLAADAIARKKVKDVNEVLTKAAIRRAATQKDAAIVKGDWTKATDFARKQMMAQALDNETQRMNERIQSIRDKAARYSRTTPKSVDPSYMEQIRALVEKYEFTKVSKTKLNKRSDLRKFLDQAREEGLVLVDMPDRLLRDAEKVNYKELTVEDLIGLGDTLDNLEHLGRMKQKLRTAKGQREFAAVKGEMLTQLQSLPQRKTKYKTYTQEQKSWLGYVSEFHASLLKPEQILEWLDAGNINGPMSTHVFQGIADAQNLQNDLHVEYTKKITDAFDKLDPKYLSEIVMIESLGVKMTREEIFATALNTGNDSSRVKLLKGHLWTEAQLQEILSHMSKNDWDAVQKVWNVLEGLWGKISAMEKRLTGVAPPKIEAREFTNAHGTYAGGYYPAVYDFKIRRGINLLEDTTPADQGIMEGLGTNAYITPGTSHKHTIKRTGAVKPIKLELAVLPRHLNNVIHDLAYREPVRAAYKLLWDADIRQAIEASEGSDVYDQLRHWLRAVATEHATETDQATRFIRRARIGATMFGMGFRVTTALAQPLGFFNSLVRVKGKYLARGIYQMTAHPFKSLEMVNGLSGELRHRFNTQERDLFDANKRITQGKGPVTAVTQYAFHMIAWMDKYVATATWLGAYAEQTAKNPGDQDLAIRHADRTVRLSQGTGTVKDFAKIMNNGEMLKLFTMFYSFFSAQYNAQVDLTRKTNRDIADGNIGAVMMQRLPQWVFLVVAPSILGALVMGQGPDEDEDTAAWAARKVLLYPISAVPFARDVVGVADTALARMAGSNKPVFDAQFSPASKLIDSGSRSIKALLGSDKDIEDRLAATLKPAAQAASIAMKLPTGQAINTIEALWKGLENGDFEAQDLLYGRRGK